MRVEYAIYILVALLISLIIYRRYFRKKADPAIVKRANYLSSILSGGEKKDWFQ